MIYLIKALNLLGKEHRQLGYPSFCGIPFPTDMTFFFNSRGTSRRLLVEMLFLRKASIFGLLT
jgi:hypothetical protein